MVSLSVFLVHLYPIKIDKPVSTLITDSGKGIDRSSEIFAKNRPKVRSLSPFVRMRYVHTSLADSQCCPHFVLSTLDHALLYPIRSRSLSLSSLSSILSFSVFPRWDNFDVRLKNVVRSLSRKRIPGEWRAKMLDGRWNSLRRFVRGVITLMYERRQRDTTPFGFETPLWIVCKRTET